MWEREYDSIIDYAELYRENYQDALDEIHNLKYRIKELERENAILFKDLTEEKTYYER